MIKYIDIYHYLKKSAAINILTIQSMSVFYQYADYAT